MQKKPMEITDPDIVQMIIEAANLRIQRKILLVKENFLKDNLKKIMLEKGVDELTTISGHCAILTKSKGRLNWDLDLLASALGILKEELKKFKTRGDPIYSLTVKEKKRS